MSSSQNERVIHFEKLSNELATKLSNTSESQLKQQQIADTAQRLCVKLQGTVDSQLKILETLRVWDPSPLTLTFHDH